MTANGKETCQRESFRLNFISQISSWVTLLDGWEKANETKLFSYLVIFYGLLFLDDDGWMGPTPVSAPVRSSC